MQRPRCSALAAQVLALKPCKSTTSCSCSNSCSLVQPCTPCATLAQCSSCSNSAIDVAAQPTQWSILLVLLYNICANHIWSTLALTEPAFEKYFGNTKTLSALLVLRTNFIEHQRHLCNMPHCIGLLYPLKALLYCTIIAAMLHNFCSRRMRWRRWRS